MLLTSRVLEPCTLHLECGEQGRGWFPGWRIHTGTQGAGQPCLVTAATVLPSRQDALVQASAQVRRWLERALAREQAAALPAKEERILQQWETHFDETQFPAQLGELTNMRAEDLLPGLHNNLALAIARAMARELRGVLEHGIRPEAQVSFQNQPWTVRRIALDDKRQAWNAELFNETGASQTVRDLNQITGRKLTVQADTEELARLQGLSAALTTFLETLPDRGTHARPTNIHGQLDPEIANSLQEGLAERSGYSRLELRKFSDHHLRTILASLT